jgi:phage tail-like protein
MWLQYVNKKTVGSLLFAGAMLSAPTRRVDLDHIGAYNFRLEIQDAAGAFVPVGTFKAVDGLDSETEVIEYQDGDDLVLRKRPGRVKYGDITLKKGYLNSRSIYEWRQQVISQELPKKAGRIILVDDANQEIARYNFFEAWPSKWKGTSLDGKGNDVLTEEIELAVEKIERG